MKTLQTYLNELVEVGDSLGPDLKTSLMLKKINHRVTTVLSCYVESQYHNTVNTFDETEVQELFSELSALKFKVINFGRFKVLKFFYTYSEDLETFDCCCYYDEDLDCFIIYGYGDIYNKALEIIKKKDVISNTIKIVVGNYDKRAEVIFSEKKINSRNYKKPLQCFYPDLKLPLNDYFKKYLESEESILLLIGPPGTGKTTFLRELIFYAAKPCLTSYDERVLTSNRFSDHFFSDEIDLCIMEDADTVIRSRSEDNVIMSTFLNGAEGIIKNSKKKLIISTNLSSVRDVDKALIRPGRCYDVIEFRNLNIEESKEIQKQMNVPEHNWSLKNKWSLAEILNNNSERQFDMIEYGKFV